MKSFPFNLFFSFLIAIFLASGCSSIANNHTSSSLGHLNRPRYVPSRTGKSFYGRKLCRSSDYHCIKIRRGDTWKALFPKNSERQLVMRLNRLNMPVIYRHWIVIPNNLSNIAYHHISPFALKIAPNKKKKLLINLREHAFAAYNTNGNLVHWGPISGGRAVCENGKNCSTVVGSFKVFRVHGKNCKSGKYPIETNGGAPMPYCMFFHRGYAIHGSTLPGYHNSHGCVRLFYEDAKWLNQFFLKIGTKVHVRH